jgi:hypothetical protein
MKEEGNPYEPVHRPAAEWLPQEQARNLREALGDELYNALDDLTGGTGSTPSGPVYDWDDYYFPQP